LSYLPQTDKQALSAAGLLPASSMNRWARKPRIAGLKTRLPSSATFVSNQNPPTTVPTTLMISVWQSKSARQFHGFLLVRGVRWAGCFDYSEWADRDRFLELDRALASAQDPEAEEMDPSEHVSNEHCCTERCEATKWPNCSVSARWAESAG
jgi:hypothetical protein